MELQKFKPGCLEHQCPPPDIEIIIYTDPLCCWSWAFHASLEKLKKQLGSKASWQVKMGGLISTWDNFYDEVNSISRPSQMGPVWMHAGQVAQRAIQHQVWMRDPPASSYPACVAVKCVQLQSNEDGETYLQLLREACMSEGKNIARQSVLFGIAERLEAQETGFSFKKFKEDYEGGSGMQAFRADLEEVHFYNITRFPTLIIRWRDGKAIMLPGYRDHGEIINAMQTVVPGIISKE